jgi:trypsin
MAMTPAIHTWRWRAGCIAALAAGLLAPAFGFANGAAAAGPPGVKVGPGIYLTDSSQADNSGSVSRSARRALRSDASPRVVGGASTTIAEWPWTAAITLNPASFSGSGLQRQFCGGSLVAPTLVITAAHCMFDFDHNSFTDAARYAAITGRTQLSSSEGQEIPFASYQFFTDAGGNPLFNPATLDFDVVLVQLASPSGASPILLAGPDEAATWERGRDAYVSGWGSTSAEGGRSDVLRAAQVGIIGDSTCGSPASYGGLFHAQFMVCAGRMAGGVDTCFGDSGGPLVVPILGGGFRLVGDTSFGPLGCGVPFLPGIYGRIADDPMRSALQNAALATAGANIVGAGAQPAPQTPPHTDILSGPPKKTSHKKARFTFLSSKDGSTFTCKLDNKAPVPCDSPVSFEAKKKGKHRLEVTATIFGITEPTPAHYKWKYSKNAKGGDHGGGGGGGGAPPPRP